VSDVAAITVVAECESATLHHHYSNEQLRLKVVPRGYDAPNIDPEVVAADGTTLWGLFYEKEDVRAFARALLQLVGDL
jgi:hypothetical protein